MSEVEISVWRAGREIDRVSRPLRLLPGGPAVTYRRRLWPVSEGAIYLDGPIAEAMTVETICGEASDAQDTAQASVIEAEAHRRLLVDAGPGTGKTWTACARAASLISQGAPPSRIWIISFTRTAVLEIRNRIAAALEDPSEAASLKISTLDAYAWSLQSGFDAAAVLMGSHDDNIERTLERIRTDEPLQDYLGRVRHLIVDEAQDIVGVRAELVEAIIAALPVQAGVTVFADPAQAIYGFTEEDRETAGGPPLIDRLPPDFERMTLTRVRRTDCPKLRELFTRTRRRVLTRASAVRDAQIRDDVARLSHRTLAPALDGGLSAIGADGLVLFRRRAEVVAASSYGKDTPHRLRMSGLPVPLRPWLARLFWDWTDRRIGRADFLHVWNERLQAQGGDNRDQAWTRLVEAAGESADVVDLHCLRTLLARAGPPLIFSTPEFGEEGPIVGTIHASKGREAEHVALWLPAPDDEAVDEEIRVLFVGCTRARTTLGVGPAAAVFGGNVQGRVWRRVNGGVQVEVGRAGDIEMEGLTGLSAFQEAESAMAAQALIVAGARQTGLLVCADAALDWRLALESSGRVRLAVLSDGLRRDLETIARDCKQWPPPNFLPHLRSIGLRSVAVRPDDPVIDRLHEPWRSSGFATAPLLTGFSPARFPRKNG